MKNLVSIVCFSFFFVMLSVIGVSAQDEVPDNVQIYNGMTWYMDKEEAFDLARKQGKQVFLLWGNDECSLCNKAKERLGQSPQKELVDAYYILWYCNMRKYKRDSPEVSDYLLPFFTPDQAINLPAVCIIDTFDITVGYGLSTGTQSASRLFAMLTRYVDNEWIADDVVNDKVNVFVSNQTLMIENDKVGETITVYSMTGSLIDTFSKNTGGLCSRHISAYPKGILLVHSSSGWTRKIIVR